MRRRYGKKRFIGHRSLGNILLFGPPSPETLAKRAAKKKLRKSK